MSEHSPTTSGRHPVHIGHLVMGLAFLGLVAVWAVVQSDLVSAHDVRWLLPVPWVVAGAVGLLATTLSSRHRWGSRRTGWVAPSRQHASPTETTLETTPATTDVPEEDR